MGYHRKTPVVLIAISIQWFQIPHIRHFQLNPILILEFDIGVLIMFMMDILKDNMNTLYTNMFMYIHGMVRGQFEPWLIRTLANSDLIRTSAVANSDLG